MMQSREDFLRVCGTGLFGLLSGASGLAAVASTEGLPAYDPSAPEPFWAAVRAAYDFEPGLTYFNTGGLGPAATAIRQVADDVTRQLQREIETGRARFDAARATLARFLGAQSSEVAFVRNATEANGIIAGGLELQRGDEVIFESHAHPGGSFPWLHQAQRRGVVVRLFTPADTDPAANVERVQALLTPRTRVVQVSHVTAPTGIVLPVAALAELCRPRGIWLHVDGAQSAGMFPFNVGALGCDSYATSGHKWLGAPHETGLLFIRHDRIAEVAPGIVGAHSGHLEELPGALELESTAARFEYGTRAAAPVVALAAAAGWQDAIGRERIAARGAFLAGRLRAGLRRLPDVEILTPEHRDLSASMLTFRSPRVRYDVLFERLWKNHRLRCRPVSEQQLDAVRVSCHLFNTPAEVDRLLEATDQILRSA